MNEEKAFDLCEDAAARVGSLRAPFPWFGGKSRAAGLIWLRLGNVVNYVEPFAGSLAVLLGRPHAPHTETVNDLDCYLANFWRALKAAPDEVARWADEPVNEADLHAKHAALIEGKEEHRLRMMSDPEYYDARLAGWWVWGLCAWIGPGWTAEKCKQLPHLTGAGVGIHRAAGDFKEELRLLARRLRRVRVACGDWRRVLGDSVTWRHGLTGVVLDPPYAEGNMEYAEHSGVSAAVREWCLENGENRLMRIALCGLDGEHVMPGWRAVRWKARGGFNNQEKEKTNRNRFRETVWFSPHCLSGDDLFEASGL